MSHIHNFSHALSNLPVVRGYCHIYFEDKDKKECHEFELTPPITRELIYAAYRAGDTVYIRDVD